MTTTLTQSQLDRLEMAREALITAHDLTQDVCRELQQQRSEAPTPDELDMTGELLFKVQFPSTDVHVALVDFLGKYRVAGEPDIYDPVSHYQSEYGPQY